MQTWMPLSNRSRIGNGSAAAVVDADDRHRPTPPHGSEGPHSGHRVDPHPLAQLGGDGVGQQGGRFLGLPEHRGPVRSIPTASDDTVTPPGRGVDHQLGHSSCPRASMTSTPCRSAMSSGSGTRSLPITVSALWERAMRAQICLMEDVGGR
jgi:hypothetical protein